MLKKFDVYFPFFQRLIDIVLVLFCWESSYFLRLKYFPNMEEGLGSIYFKLFFVIGLVTLYSFEKNGLYRSQRFNSRTREILAVFKANTFAVFSFVIILYFFADSRISRMVIGLYFLLSSFLLTLFRIIIRNYLRHIRKKGFNLRHILLVGDGPQILDYILAVRSYKDCGLNFIGWYDDNGLRRGGDILELKIDDPSKAKDYIKSIKPDSMVVGYTSQNGHKLENFLKDHFNDVIPIQVLPDLSYSWVGHKIEDFAGVPILSVNRPQFNLISLFIKRSIDIFATVIGLIILAPFFLLLALIIKLTSRGPVFYGQERGGAQGRPFTMWKFRSMEVAHNGEDQNSWGSKNNPRKTKVGTILRKTSLDELPQLWNVLMGEMSLVGPRPERLYFIEKFRHEIPGYMLRHTMKAGITGWAQINGWRGDTDLHKRIECDLFYIKNWSLWLDIKILFLTFWKGLVNKNAY